MVFLVTYPLGAELVSLIVPIGYHAGEPADGRASERGQRGDDGSIHGGNP